MTSLTFFYIGILVIVANLPEPGHGAGFECNIAGSGCGKGWAPCCSDSICEGKSCKKKSCNPRGGVCSGTVNCCVPSDTCHEGFCVKNCRQELVSCFKEYPCCSGLKCVKGLNNNYCDKIKEEDEDTFSGWFYKGLWFQPWFYHV